MYDVVGGDLQSGQLRFCHGDSRGRIVSSDFTGEAHATKRSLTETMMCATMKSSARKERKEMFSQAVFLTALTRDMAGAFAQLLEMVRMAPLAKIRNLSGCVKRKSPITFMRFINPDFPKQRKQLNKWILVLPCPISI